MNSNTIYVKCLDGTKFPLRLAIHRAKEGIKKCDREYSNLPLIKDILIGHYFESLNTLNSLLADAEDMDVSLVYSNLPSKPFYLSKSEVK